MTKENKLQIKVNRTGFPVAFGEVELWFNSSPENVTNLLKADELAKKHVTKLRAKYKHIKFDKIPKKPQDYAKLDNGTINAALDIQKEFIKFQYDLVFGKGSFNKLYKVYPDMLALESALKDASEHIRNIIENEAQSE